MLVSDAMSRNVVTVSAGTSIIDAVSVANEYGIEYLPVLEGAHVLGMLAASELAQSPLDSDASGAMHVPAVTIDASATLEQAVARMDAREVSCLLALEGGCLAGILTRGDLLRAGLAEELVIGDRRCSACGTHRHVQRRARDGLMLCLDCRDRSIPPTAGEELGIAG